MISNDAHRHTRIAIIGAGFGGIGAAIRLRGAGRRDFLVFDRGAEVGGAWRDNTYPGCACDVPSHLYSFSFARNPGWSRSFSPQPEIWAYLRRCADEHGVRPHLRLGHEVHGAAWDGEAQVWRLDTSQGAYTAEVLVAAGGPLTEPSIPDLPGLDDFQGETFHSARWRHDLDLRGRRVAVVGTGASAVQFVPQLAPQVARLTLFQRTPAWVLPRRDRRITALERRLFRAAPLTHRLARAAAYWGREAQGTAFLRPALMRVGQALARRHLRRSVADPALRERLTPSYTMGCKRVLLSDDFYPALARDNVDLVTEPITRVTADGVVTADGRSHPVDAIVFGTGFHVTDLPMARAIRGADGRTLAEHWAGSMYAYRGIAVTGFPNLFLLLGPNTGLGHNSVVFMIECQLAYLLGALRHLDTAGVTAIEPDPDVQRRHNEALDRRMAGTVWTTGGCRSWYLDEHGRNSTLWPGYTWSYWLRTRRFDPGAYRAVPVGTAHPGWIDTDLVRDARDDLPSFRDSFRAMPWPVGSITSVERCAEAFVRGIARRRRRVYVPRAIAGVHWLRTLVSSRLADALVGRRSRVLVPRMEQEVAALGRSFGVHSTETREEAA